MSLNDQTNISILLLCYYEFRPAGIIATWRAQPNFLNCHVYSSSWTLVQVSPKCSPRSSHQVSLLHPASSSQPLHRVRFGWDGQVWGSGHWPPRAVVPSMCRLWMVDCHAADYRLLNEQWADGQLTPLCSTCDNTHYACHWCQGLMWCTSPPEGVNLAIRPPPQWWQIDNDIVFGQSTPAEACKAPMMPALIPSESYLAEALPHVGHEQDTTLSIESRTKHVPAHIGSSYIHIYHGRLESQMPFRCLPDASQMPLRCLSNASQMPLRCLSDASQMCPRCLPDASSNSYVFWKFARIFMIICHTHVHAHAHTTAHMHWHIPCWWGVYLHMLNLWKLVTLTAYFWQFEDWKSNTSKQ